MTFGKSAVSEVIGFPVGRVGGGGVAFQFVGGIPALTSLIGGSEIRLEILISRLLGCCGKPRL